MQTENRHSDIDGLITQYLSGHIDMVALAQLRNWTKQSESNRTYMRQQVEIWFSSGVSGDTTFFDKEEAFRMFQQRITQSQKKKTIYANWRNLYRVAVVILILLLPLATYWGGKQTLTQKFADIVVEAPLGARTKLCLPDGTLAWLNAGSKITYSQGFGIEERRLLLDGEGYFEVTHNTEMPFEIQTKEVGLKVLGTKFNFRNYSDDDEVAVCLMEGRVALHNNLKDMPELLLEPDEKMTLNKLTGEMIKLKVNSGSERIWTHNELFFDEDMLPDIAKKLMRTYDVQIEVADSLKTKCFYGEFKVVENTVEEILQTIASTNQMSYRIENGVYKLY